MTRIALLLLSALTAALVLATVASASPSGVVVSQVYGAGGNTGAVYANDFVELVNAGSAAVDLTGWTIQYASATGTAWQATPLSGTIAPGGYYLVQLGGGTAGGGALPSPDATGTTNLSAASGKIALVRSDTLLACGATAGSCSADATVEDLVGYGSATDFEGSGTAPSTSAAEAAARAGGGCVDTDDNAADFAAAAPAPRTTASPAASCSTGPPPPAGGSGTAGVDLDVAPVLAISLSRPTLSFGSVVPGTTPPSLSEDVSVVSNNLAGYSLGVDRSAFAPSDLPLALSATAPANGTLGPSLAGGALAPIPVSPASPLVIGTTSAPTAGAGDAWPTQIGFASPLDTTAAGHYTATVTYTVVAR